MSVFGFFIVFTDVPKCLYILMIMQNNLKAHGDFPNGHVFKAFSKVEHAEAFVKEGQFRMGSLQNYRSIEDAERRDVSEGYGHIRVFGQVVKVHLDANDSDYYEVTEAPGHRDVRTELGNPIYIFSTSLPNVDLGYLVRRFGQFIVQIDTPKQLALDITEHLKQRPEKYAGGVEGRYVSYNRGEIVDEELDRVKRIVLSYSQKSVKFINEREFRFVVISMDRPSEKMIHEYIEINLGGPLAYARIIGSPGRSFVKPISLM